MTTYAELKAEAERLLVQAEELRKREVDQVISDIKQKIAEYGLTPRDLGFTDISPRTKRHISERSQSIRYVGPEGQKWSGLGRPPQWMKDALAAGKRKEQFAT